MLDLDYLKNLEERFADRRNNDFNAILPQYFEGIVDLIRLTSKKKLICAKYVLAHTILRIYPIKIFSLRDFTWQQVQNLYNKKTVFIDIDGDIRAYPYTSEIDYILDYTISEYLFLEDFLGKNPNAFPSNKLKQKSSRIGKSVIWGHYNRSTFTRSFNKYLKLYAESTLKSEHKLTSEGYRKCFCIISNLVLPDKEMVRDVVGFSSLSSVEAYSTISKENISSKAKLESRRLAFAAIHKVRSTTDMFDGLSMRERLSFLNSVKKALGL